MIQGKFGPYVNEDNVWTVWEEMYNKQEKEKEEEDGDN